MVVSRKRKGRIEPRSVRWRLPESRWKLSRGWDGRQRALELARVEAEAEKARTEAVKAEKDGAVKLDKIEINKELELEKLRHEFEKEKLHLACQVEKHKADMVHEKSTCARSQVSVLRWQYRQNEQLCVPDWEVRNS